jgi:hypothetical protein
MYKDNYEVFKIPTTINKIKPHSSVEFGEIDIDFKLLGKNKNAKDDIVFIRSIVLTDDLITWIDKDEFKITEIKKSQNYYSENSESDINLNNKYKPLGISAEDILKTIKDEVSVNIEESYIGDDKIKMKLPRILSYLNPVFSINELADKEVVFPKLSELNGKNIDLEFNYDLEDSSKINFHVSSIIGNIISEIEIDKSGKIKNIDWSFI